MIRTLPSTALVLSLAGLCLAGTSLVACDKKEAPAAGEEKPSAKADAGLDDEALKGADPDLAKAMKAAQSAQKPATAKGEAGGPPLNGIFGPGEADKAAAKGAPATFTLGADGSEPRVQLGPGLKPGTKHSGTVDIATQADPQQGAIPIQFGVSIEVNKPKAEGEAPAPAGSVVVIKITSAKINAPGVPADLATAVGKLKGSRIDYQVGADGVASHVKSEIPKGVDPSFRDPVQALTDLMVGVTMPVPSKPVGVGGFWMTTTRDVLMGLDVVSYRLVKVEKIEGTAVSLSLNTKRYAASPAFELEGLPPDAPKTMAEFRSAAEGKLTLLAGEVLPKSGEIQSLIGAALGEAGARGPHAMVQVQSRATLSF
jgi:hypothetical protein